MFLSVDGTALVQLVNFAIFFAVLSVVFLRPVGRAISERRAYINSLAADYERYRSEAAEFRAQAESIRDDARREADRILSTARNEAGNEAANMSTEYATRVKAIVEGAHATVAQEVEAIRPREDAIASELAAQIVGRVLPEIHT
ncbi:MAG TPA: ATP synthase F0 subunit B [Candidatus Acidoferrum sp.]|nr:ATP synthase F0 subunit B [Candidatus Acidoferrum sp.]